MYGVFQMSGVTVLEEVKLAFDDMKLKEKYKFIILKFSDDAKNIIIDQTSQAGKFKYHFFKYIQLNNTAL